MNANLQEALTQVQDFRALRGRRYRLWLLLLSCDYGDFGVVASVIAPWKILPVGMMMP